MRRKHLLALGLLSMLLTGCISYRAPVIPPQGGIYMHVTAPLMPAHDRTLVTGEKKGSASTSFFRVPLIWGGVLSFAWDDALAKEAAVNGRIKTVQYADYDFLQILGIYGRFTVNVYGDQ